MNWGKSGAAFAALVIILVSFYWYVFDKDTFLGFDPEGVGGLPADRIAISAVALLTGIIFGAFHRLWREWKEPLNFAAIKAGLRSAELWRSLLAAPLVFSGVYAAARSQPDYVLAFFFAFQTGFFTDAVIQAKMKEQEGGG